MPSQESEFAEITILTHSEAAEGLSDVLFSLGAKGVAEERRPVGVRLFAYLPSDDKLEEHMRAIRARLTALEKEGLRIGHGTVGVRTLGGQAWSDAWQDHFQVLNIAPGLVVAPSWEDYQPQPGESVVILDPGAAFGTGGHATTRLCLRGLLSHLRPGDRVADVGCGSGILGITAVMLGASEVVAIDNDQSALPVAQTNARRNGVLGQIRFVEADLLPDPSEPFDFIVCNIVAEEVIRLAERLRALLSRGGRFVGSGFFSTAVPRVEDALARAGLDIVETLGEEGWAACVAARPQRGR
ncbi:MAG: 50S ribosomal protein L11 methyltransferase [Armatimonadota bacterium]|nr:MAG: 50S ribosomal protein L11 methyltransferase [Armatimonadota bacterium]